jgi:hypothetical protein
VTCAILRGGPIAASTAGGRRARGYDFSMRTSFEQEVASLGLAPPPKSTAVVTEDDVRDLPEPARRYLHFMRVVGRARDAAFRATLRGRFLLSAESSWRSFESWQYNQGAPEVARLFFMRLRMFGIPVQGRDFYLRGKGSLVIRPLDLFTVVSAGGVEFDLGEMVTWLNDAVLLAPSMLLCDAITWEPVDDGAFDLAFRDRGNAVRARVFVDERGAVTNFRTEDRWYAPAGSNSPIRLPWTTPIEGWQRAGERMLLTRGKATWKRVEGDLTYIEFEVRPGDVEFGASAA